MAELITDKTTSKEVAQESNDLHQAINTALKAEEGGTKVHVFDPDMSPEEKKAEALKNVDVPQIKKDKAPLATDIGSADNEKVAEALSNVPTITTTPPPTSSSPPKKASPPPTAKSTTPGSFVQDPLKPGIPDWFHVGWTSFSNLPNPGDENAMAEFSKTHSPEEVKELYAKPRESNGSYEDDFIAQFINEKYFGEWYHNCGVVFVAIFFTWLLIKLRFGLFSCLITGAFFGKFVTPFDTWERTITKLVYFLIATYYRTSIKRTRRNARDDMQRLVSLNRLETDVETVGWMNLFMSRFWLIFEPVLSAQVIGQVDAILAENTPSFLDSIRMSSFTLGTKAPSVDGIKVYPSSAPDVVVSMVI